MGFPSCCCFERQNRHDSSKDSLLVKEIPHPSNNTSTRTEHWSEISTDLVTAQSTIPSSPANNDFSASKTWPTDKVLKDVCSELKFEQKDSRDSFMARDFWSESELRMRFSVEKSGESHIFSTMKYRQPGKETTFPERQWAFSSLDTLGERNVTRSTATSISSYRPYPMSQILPHLYIGGISDANNEHQLKEKRITHILSLDSKSSANLENIEHFPMSDKGRTSLKEVLDKTWTFIEKGQKDGNTILIHCHLGQNRSAAVVIAFLMMKMMYKNNPYTLFRAHKEVKTARPLVMVNREYAKQLLALEKELHGVNSLPQNWMEQEPFNKATGELTFKYASLDSEAQCTWVKESNLY